jgi:hypothetical protein
MNTATDDEIKRWTARRKSTLVVEFIQGRTTVAEESQAYDRRPSEIDTWIDEGKGGMENALRANPRMSGESTPSGTALTGFRGCR